MNMIKRTSATADVIKITLSMVTVPIMGSVRLLNPKLMVRFWAFDAMFA